MTEKIRNAIVTQMDSNGPCLLAQIGPNWTAGHSFSKCNVEVAHSSLRVRCWLSWSRCSRSQAGSQAGSQAAHCIIHQRGVPSALSSSCFRLVSTRLWNTLRCSEHLIVVVWPLNRKLMMPTKSHDILLWGDAAPVAEVFVWFVWVLQPLVGFIYHPVKLWNLHLEQAIVGHRFGNLACTLFLVWEHFSRGLYTYIYIYFKAWHELDPWLIISRLRQMMDFEWFWSNVWKCVKAKALAGFGSRKAFVEEGPFDGVVGFSQGGCLAGLLAAMQPRGRAALVVGFIEWDWDECENDIVRQFLWCSRI